MNNTPSTGDGARKGMLCPSSRPKPGSALIGVRQDDGTVAILPQPLPVDDNFLRIAAEHPLAPDQRFRFTNKCVESGCSQWTGSRCGVIDQALTMMESAIEESLPACGIRPTCRWFDQSGAAACKACTLIITRTTESDLPMHPATPL
jgi:hypothetical protein